jgi:hypothetical protein
LTGGEVRCTRKTSLRNGLEKLDGNVAVWIPIHDTGADPSAQLARYRRTQVRLAVPLKIMNSLFTLASGPGRMRTAGPFPRDLYRAVRASNQRTPIHQLPTNTLMDVNFR